MRLKKLSPAGQSRSTGDLLRSGTASNNTLRSENCSTSNRPAAEDNTQERPIHYSNTWRGPQSLGQEPQKKAERTNGYSERKVDGKYTYESFTSPYTGFHHIPYEGAQRRIGQYRWHIVDPIRFDEDLRVTIQSLGWQSEGRYLPLQDDLAGTAYWYQLEPHNPFPELPADDKLVIEWEAKEQE